MKNKHGLHVKWNTKMIDFKVDAFNPKTNDDAADFIVVSCAFSRDLKLRRLACTRYRLDSTASDAAAAPPVKRSPGPI